MTDTSKEHTRPELPGADTNTPVSRSALVLYLAMSMLLLVFVALLTGNRSEKLDADAWEHHRAVLVMSENLTDPGNPTYASDEPTIRFSPYTVVLALIVRTTGLDAYDALSAAAVFNMLLMLTAVWVWLRAYNLQNAGPCVLLCILFLYGFPPGYANSLALSDLPWHQVNPSALVMPVMILSWAWLARLRGAGLILFTLVTAIVLALALLTHAMSAAMGGLGLLVTAIASGQAGRPRRIAAVLLASVLSFALATAWPWYNFVHAFTHTPESWYWYNPVIFRTMLLAWCMPAILGAVVTLTLRDQPFVRTCIYATGAVLLLALGGALLGSPTLARLPLAGLIFPQAAAGVYLYQAGTFDPRTWPQVFRRLYSHDREVMNPALLEVTGLALLIAFSLPNFYLTASQPHLARKWIAPALNKEDKQPRIRETYHALLSPHIQPGDVVIAQPMTGWPVPSFEGRLVAALHLEYFSLDQTQRVADLRAFFNPTTDPRQRNHIIKHYDAAWIMLDREWMDPHLFTTLCLPDTVVQDDGQYVLLDAQAWAELNAPSVNMP